MAEPGKAAIKYLSVKACVTSIAMIAPMTGRSADAVNAIATGEVTSGSAAPASSVARILNTKTKPDAASRTRGIRPSILGYHDSIAPQKGVAQKVLEYDAAPKMSGENNNRGISEAKRAPHTGTSMDRRFVILTSSPTANGKRKSAA